MENEIKLGELLASKVYHDISGIVGAITNSLEFIDEVDPQLQLHARNLLKQSAADLTNRLSFYRKLYGYFDGTLSVNLEELLQIISSFFQERKINLVYSLQSLLNYQEKFDDTLAKILINIIYIAGMSASAESTLHLDYNGDSNSFHIIIEGKTIKLNADAQVVLLNKADYPTMTVRNIQFFYTAKLLTASKFNLQIISHNPNKLELLLQ